MPSKPRTCAQQIALDIARYGLIDVHACVQMAWELVNPPEPRKRKAKDKLLDTAGVLVGKPGA